MRTANAADGKRLKGENEKIQIFVCAYFSDVRADADFLLSAHVGCGNCLPGL